MGFVKATEAKQPHFLKCLIYGNAGTGKTTFALSAPGPIALIDFDNGLHRVNYQHKYNVDVLQPTNWQEMLSDISDVNAMRSYKTIVVDTIDKMMDMIYTYKCGMRQPGRSDWTGINDEFKRFIRVVDEIGKNVIFLSHETKSVEKDARGNDITKYTASLRAKNFEYVQNQLDLLGFMQFTENNGRVSRTMTFHSNICDCKQPSGIPDIITIPEVLDSRGVKTIENEAFVTLILNPYMNMKSRENEELRLYNELISTMKADIDAVVDGETAMQFAEKQKEYKHIGNSLIVMRQLFSSRLATIGLRYDSKTNSYVSAA